ncbi:NIPSNAP family protein [Chlorogloeopsis sp. ULAP02]|uniref:NIPSNAP family protein n=1 Tax=Chlorogloeopsis sp. ULAP02 TaxID=3107926 RepID=UPI003136E2AF
MLGSASPIYEVVSGQILLGKREEFTNLHQNILLPMVHEAGIEPVLMLVTEVGQYAQFMNIYRYTSLEEYGKRSDDFMKNKRVSDFFTYMIQCVDGALKVELAVDLLPFALS